MNASCLRTHQHPGSTAGRTPAAVPQVQHQVPEEAHVRVLDVDCGESVGRGAVQALGVLVAPRRRVSRAMYDAKMMLRMDVLPDPLLPISSTCSVVSRTRKCGQNVEPLRGEIKRPSTRKLFGTIKIEFVGLSS